MRCSCVCWLPGGRGTWALQLQRRSPELPPRSTACHLVRTTCRNPVCLNIRAAAADSSLALHVTTPRPIMSSHPISTTVDSSQATWDAAAMLDALPERVNRYRLRDLAILYCNLA